MTRSTTITNRCKHSRMRSSPASRNTAESHHLGSCAYPKLQVPGDEPTPQIDTARMQPRRRLGRPVCSRADIRLRRDKVVYIDRNGERPTIRDDTTFERSQLKSTTVLSCPQALAQHAGVGHAPQERCSFSWLQDPCQSSQRGLSGATNIPTDKERFSIATLL